MYSEDLPAAVARADAAETRVEEVKSKWAVTKDKLRQHKKENRSTLLQKIIIWIGVSVTSLIVMFLAMLLTALIAECHNTQRNMENSKGGPISKEDRACKEACDRNFDNIAGVLLKATIDPITNKDWEPQGVIKCKCWFEKATFKVRARDPNTK